ncbi:BTAD domain-containing putative transcriptional regulator [Kibdelosporangium lantanae]
MAVRFGVLGSVAAWVDGVPVDVGHARRRCVLAVLVMEVNQVVSADRLVERVWGDRAPDKVRTTLYSYLYHLRRLLPPDRGAAIQRRSGGYVLAADPQAVDAHLFTGLVAEARTTADRRAALARYDQALALWRGEPFADLESPWIDQTRAGLDLARLAAELDRADVGLELGEHTELISTLPRLAARYPTDERLAGQLMRALHGSGRRADALEHYQRVRRLLVEELGNEPGPALRKAHQQILDDDGPDEEPVATRGHVVPRQLPARPGLFVGRGDELAVLTKAVVRGAGATMPVVVVSGLGGIGKTWLVLRWAHQNLDRYPDGQLYVDLRGFDPTTQPVPAAVAVRGMLDALRVEGAAVPVDPAAQAALYRSLTAERRMLVVLDNARDTEQVVPLLPGGAGCAVLVTSRHRLPGLVAAHGARPLALDPLPAGVARELLAQSFGADRVSADPESTARVIDHCAGLPLALSVGAARALTQPGLSVAALADDLNDIGLDALDTDDLSASLRAVFRGSYRTLGPELAMTFALLGLVSGPDIGLLAAASLVGQPVTEAAVRMRDLELRSLVTQHRRRRYRMHDLLRHYAADCADGYPAEERDAALYRLVAHYVHTAYLANRVLAPERQDVDVVALPPGCVTEQPTTHAHALAWFGVEHANLLAAQQLAARRGWNREVWLLAWALTTYHRKEGDLNDDLDVWQAAIVAIDSLGDSADRAATRVFLSQAHARLGDYAEAHRRLGEALLISEQTGDVVNQLRIHHALAMTLGRQDDYAQALRHARTALDLARRTRNKVWEPTALNAVGWYSAKLGDVDSAVEPCTTALAMFHELGDGQGEGSALDSLGYIAAARGDHHTALAHYREAVAVFQRIGNSYQQANALDHLAMTHLALGDRAEARAVGGQAIDLYRGQNRTAEANRLAERLSG